MFQSSNWTVTGDDIYRSSRVGIGSTQPTSELEITGDVNIKSKATTTGIPTSYTGSVEFDGTNDYLNIAASADFNFGTGDFTIEWFKYWNAPRVDIKQYGQITTQLVQVYSYKLGMEMENIEFLLLEITYSKKPMHLLQGDGITMQ